MPSSHNVDGPVPAALAAKFSRDANLAQATTKGDAGFWVCCNIAQKRDAFMIAFARRRNSGSSTTVCKVVMQPTYVPMTHVSMAYRLYAKRIITQSRHGMMIEGWCPDK